MSIGPCETGTAGPITVEPFTVQTHYMRVTVAMPKAAAEFLARQSEFIQFHLGPDVGTYATRGESRMKSKSAEDVAFIREMARSVEANTSPGGTKRTPFSIELRAAHWESVQAVSKHLGVDAGRLILSALQVRLLELKSQERRKTAGKR